MTYPNLEASNLARQVVSEWEGDDSDLATLARQAVSLEAQNAQLRAALEIYANPAHWRRERKNMGQGDTFEAVAWIGPDVGHDYRPTKGPEWAREALTDS